MLEIACSLESVEEAELLQVETTTKGALVLVSLAFASSILSVSHPRLDQPLLVDVLDCWLETFGMLYQIIPYSLGSGSAACSFAKFARNSIVHDPSNNHSSI